MTQTIAASGLTPVSPAAPGAVGREAVAAGSSFGSVLAQMTSDARADGQTVAADGAQGVPDGALSVVGASNMAVMSLSPALRVITDGGMNVSAQSLQAFAKSQGLSEDALNSLALLAAQGGAQVAGQVTGQVTGQTIAPMLQQEQLLSGDMALRGRGFAGVVDGAGIQQPLMPKGPTQSGPPVDLSGMTGLSGSVAAQLGILTPAASGVPVGSVVVSVQPGSATPTLGQAGASVLGSADLLVQRVPSAVVAAPGMPVAQVALGAVQPTLADAADVAKLLAGSVQLQPGGRPPAVVNAVGGDANASPVLAAAPAVATATLLQMPQALAMLRAKPGAVEGQPWRQEATLEGVTGDDVVKLMSEGWVKGGDAASHAAGHSMPQATSVVTAPLPTTGQALGDWHQQQFDALSDKLGQAVAQRIQAQIQRGHWHMSLTLHPQELGSVDVQLGMRGNDLSASFNAAQALTRDLLQDSMPRLREMLSGAGIDVASADVGGQMGQGSGGNSTPARSPERVETGSTLGEVAPASVQTKAQSADDGLDLWA